MNNFSENLNKSNNELKNRLLNFERPTVNLDWEAKPPLITGNATQPSLKTLLEESLEFWSFFMKSSKSINDSFKNIDLNNETSIQTLKNSFAINLETNKSVYNLISLTQYVDNENSVL